MDNEKNEYLLTLITRNNIRKIYLNEFSSDKITFGKDNDNDITIDSNIVSRKHGYFEFNNNDLYIVDNSSKNGLFVNNTKKQTHKIQYNDYIKIDNPDKSLIDAVVLIITKPLKNETWKYKKLYKNVTSISNSDTSDLKIQLPNVVKEIKIFKRNDIFFIEGNNYIKINGKSIPEYQELKNKDVIEIYDKILVYDNNSLIYPKFIKELKIEAFDVTKTVRIKHKKVNLTDHINMSINPGELVAFIGASGTGKSTFMNILAGISKPTSGKVLINDLDLFKNYNYLKKKIGYVPQDDIVYSELTLYEMLKYSANLRMDKKATVYEKENRIKEVIETVDLIGRESVKIKNLSGGQRKRVGIAVELLADPRILFLDEPTSGLDPGTEKSIMLLLKKMSKENRTIILITHHTLNLYLCNKLVFFGHGGIICFSGSPKDAKAFFNTDDLVDIYNTVGNKPSAWNKLYLKSEYNEINKLSDNIKDQSKINESKVTKHDIKDNNNIPGFFRQFKTLINRYVKIQFSNKTNILILLLFSPLIAFLLYFVMPDRVFEIYGDTKTILFCLANAMIYVGLSNSIQEICKEKNILKKEYMSNLNLHSYLLSKVVVLTIIALIQSVLFILVFTILCDVPANGVLYTFKTELFLEVFITLFASESMGLLVSSVSNGANVATSITPILMIPQMLLSGVFFKLTDSIKPLSNVIIAKWSVNLFGITADLNSNLSDIEIIKQNYTRTMEKEFDFTISNLNSNFTILIFISIFCLVSSYIILRRQLEVK